MQETIVIKGARENNLKNIDLEIPRDKLVVLTGLSGYFEEPNAIDGETIVGITAADRSGGKIVEASIINFCRVA